MKRRIFRRWLSWLSWLSWVSLAVVVVVALVIGSAGQHHATDLDSRVRAIASDIRCPTCSGQSAADSEAPASQEIRAIIRQQLQQGQSAGQIKAYLVSRYGPRILLRPETRGLSLLVWVLPVIALGAGAVIVGMTLRRRRHTPLMAASDEDRLLVDQALNE